MAAHEQSVGASDEWYTPPWLFEALRMDFGLDAASPGADTVPWIPAREHFTYGSLERPWGNRSVWLNPPYGPRNGVVPWLRKAAEHGNALCLVPNRTGADWWQDFAKAADGVLFVRGKIRFLRPDGSEGASPGYGNVLMAFGRDMARKLRASTIDGFRSLPSEVSGE